MPSETALVEMMPYGRHRLNELHLLKALAKHLVQIFVDGKDTNGIEGGQYVVKHGALLLVLHREAVVEERLDEGLFELFYGNQQRWGVNDHLSLLDVAVRDHQFRTLEGLAEIGRHRDATLHDIGFKVQWACGVGDIVRRKGKRAFPDADGDLSSIHYSRHLRRISPRVRQPPKPG